MSPTVSQRPIADDLFTWPSDDPQLIGSRCRACGVVMFPAQGSCPACTGSDTERHLLARRGTLWSWTIQGFLPKSPYAVRETPETFTPYGVGYVDLAGEIKVEGRLTLSDPDLLHIGMEMELVVVPLTVDDGGTELLTFAFGPVAA